MAQLDRNTNDTAALIARAQAADAADRNLTIWQAIKKYKRAVFWSTLLSTALIMEGYDVVIVRYDSSIGNSHYEAVATSFEYDY